MDNLIQDLRYCGRVLRRQPGFTSIVLLIIGLGIGANTAIYSVVNSVLLRPLPYKQPDRLVMISQTDKNREPNLVTPADYTDWQRQSQLIESIAAIRPWSANLTDIEDPQRVQGAVVTASFFDVLGVQPALGRVFTPEEDVPDAGPVVVLSHGLWQRLLGSDPNIIGRPLSLNGAPRIVLGIMSPDFRLPLFTKFQANTEMWAPMAMSDNYKTRRGSHQLRVVGRLKPGITVAQAQSEMDGISEEIETQFGQRDGWSVGVVSMHEQTVKAIRPALLVILGVVGLVLLIACANVANLLLVKASSRQREAAIRTALGASRGRLVKQFFVESLALAIIGGALGVLLAYWGVRVLASASPENIPHLKDVSIDGRVLVFTLVISVITGLIFGLAPAMEASNPNLNETLKEGSKGSGTSFGKNRLRGMLVISELALALVLLIGAGLLVRSFMRLQSLELGFNPQNVLTLQMSLPWSKYTDGQAQAAFFRNVLDRVRLLSGLQTAGVTTALPLTGSTSTSVFTIEGRTERTQQEELHVVSPDYFRAMGIPLLSGRDFSEQDVEKSPLVVVVSRTLARRYWPEEDAIGKRIKLSGDPEEPWRSIVGIVEDIRQTGLENGVTTECYLPYAQDTWNLISTMTLVARSSSDPAGMASRIRTEIRMVDPDMPVYNIKTGEQLIADASSQRRFNLLLVAVFASLALVLAAIGIYGVLAYSVSQRTHEIGIRMALGAKQSDIVKLVIRQAIALILVGLGIGIVAAFGFTRVMASLLYGVSATDPVTFVVVPLFLGVTAVAASYIPALRATRVNPLLALKYE